MTFGQENYRLMLIIKDIHFYTRWVVLILVLSSIITAYFGWRKGRHYKKGLFASTLGIVHLQIILGIVLYISNVLPMFDQFTMKDIMESTEKRFLVVEHISMMVLAGILITVGYSWGKRAAHSPQKFKRTGMMYLFAFVLMLAGIPWHKSLF
jgi:membrane protein DedA with SNARE-associated domain